MKNAENTSIRTSKVSNIAIIGMLSALSTLLYFFEFPLPFFPPFLQIDLTDLPAVVGTIFFGLPVGIFVQFIKNVVHLILMGKTGGVGEIANFFVGIAYIVPLGIAYAKSKNVKGFVIGSILGTLLMTISSCFFNYYFTIPVFAKVFNMQISDFVGMASSINKNVIDFKSFIVLSVAPFNVIKAVLISVLGFLLYKTLGKHIKAS